MIFIFALKNDFSWRKYNFSTPFSFTSFYCTLSPAPLHFTKMEVNKYMHLTSNSSSPIRMRPSVAAGPSGLIPTTKMLMRDLSLLPARLSPSPFLSFSSSIMCNSPGSSAYLCLIFSIKIKRKRKWNRAVKFILQRCQHFPNHNVNPLQWMVLFGEWSTWGHS